MTDEHNEFQLFPEATSDATTTPTAAATSVPRSGGAATTAAPDTTRERVRGESADHPSTRVETENASRPKSVPPARKTIDQLNSATARVQRPAGYRDYNPIEGDVVPLNPEVIVCESEVNIGGQAVQRRYHSLAMHGAIDYHFDADDYPATAAYTARLEREPVDAPDTGFDPLFEQELDARRALTQPPEAISDFRGDLADPEFVHRLTGDPIVPHQPPLQVLHEQAKVTVTESLAKTAAGLMAESGARADFFAAQPEYNLPGPLREAREREMLASQEANFRAVLEQLDNELIKVPTGVNDTLRRQLEEERTMLGLDQPPAPAPAPAAPTAAVANAKLLSTEEARELFTVNPLALLPVEMRGNFMSMPEISAVWRLLYPYILQTERHRAHVNTVELVRGMALCGAKFDGCIRLSTHARIGDLLDRDFYGGSYDVNDRLLGGHEHYDEVGGGGRTTLAIFKFYVVRRSKENVALLSRAIEEQTKTSGDRPATESRAANRASTQFLNLNAAGLLDLDGPMIDTESDGTEAEGTLHSIRYLAREFMFCIRVVCVEPPACDCTDDAEFYPSDADEPGPTSDNVSFFDKRTTRADDDDDELLDEIEDDAANAEDGRFFVHSDDETEIELARYKRSTHESVPASAVNVNKKCAEHCVGKWKADEFSFQINTQVLKRLCVRSFLFYSDANVERK